MALYVAVIINNKIIIVSESLVCFFFLIKSKTGHKSKALGKDLSKDSDQTNCVIAKSEKIFS